MPARGQKPAATATIATRRHSDRSGVKSSFPGHPILRRGRRSTARLKRVPSHTIDELRAVEEGSAAKESRKPGANVQMASSAR